MSAAVIRLLLVVNLCPMMCRFAVAQTDFGAEPAPQVVSRTVSHASVQLVNPPVPVEQLPPLPPLPEVLPPPGDVVNDVVSEPLVIPPESQRRIEIKIGAEPSKDDPEDGHGRNYMRWVIGGRDRIGAFIFEQRGVLSEMQPESLAFALGYTIRFLDGPSVTDLPPRLYGFHYGVQWRSELRSDWEYELVVAPGIYSDFEDSAREGLRIQGRGLLRYHVDSDLQVVGGIDYLDRETVRLLPIAGIEYSPTERTILELVFPRARVRQKYMEDDDGVIHWGVISLGYEGDSFAIERISGAADVVTLDEFKLAVSYERTRQGRKFGYWEFGYLFGRSLRYRSGLGDFDPGNTVLLSWGTHY